MSMSSVPSRRRQEAKFRCKSRSSAYACRRQHRPARRLDDHGAALCRDILPAEKFYRWNPALSIGDRSEIKDYDSIFDTIYQRFDPCRKTNAILATEQASKDAILQRPAERLSQLLHQPQALGVRDVVGQ